MNNESEERDAFERRAEIAESDWHSAERELQRLRQRMHHLLVIAGDEAFAAGAAYQRGERTPCWKGSLGLADRFVPIEAVTCRKDQ